MRVLLLFGYIRVCWIGLWHRCFPIFTSFIFVFIEPWTAPFQVLYTAHTTKVAGLAILTKCQTQLWRGFARIHYREKIYKVQNIFIDLPNEQGQGWRCRNVKSISNLTWWSNKLNLSVDRSSLCPSSPSYHKCWYIVKINIVRTANHWQGWHNLRTYS